jgi:hypothetical protein
MLNILTLVNSKIYYKEKTIYSRDYRFLNIQPYAYRIPLYMLYITALGPSKSDSASVWGDLAYEPAGLRIQQSQRRDVA